MIFSFESLGITDEQIMGNNVTQAGNPTGGWAKGTGLDIEWQDGPIDRDAGEEPNGAFVEDVIQVCILRMEFYQDSRFACPENAEALASLQLALAPLARRREDRGARGVLGKHEE